MKRITFSLIFFVSMATHGCSSNQLYESIQHNARLECRKAPPAEYDNCMRRASESYGDYTRKRNEVVNDK